MKIIIKPRSSKNIIATIAIGDEYYSQWEFNAAESWLNYCERHGLGLIVFDENLISVDDKYWKKATWQKMLIGESLLRHGVEVNNVCYLDTDFLINWFAPNVFDEYDSTTIGLVSMYNSMPYPAMKARRRLAFLRNRYYDQKYPLDSSLFMSIGQIYKYHDLPVQKDFACMGFILFNIDNHSALMRNWFEQYDRDVHSLTGGGDQSHINYEIQNWGKVSWLDYKYQALWIYEMPIKYPFLYEKKHDNKLIRQCIESSLYENYFLHFAGSWHESDMWKVGGIFGEENALNDLEDYYRYLETPVFGAAKGQIKPNLDK